MYLSHPVRRMREEPIEGETATLVVTAEEEDHVPALESKLEAIGEGIERLEFGALAVTVTQEDIDSVCAVDGIEAIETEDAVGIGGDAGEDL